MPNTPDLARSRTKPNACYKWWVVVIHSTTDLDRSSTKSTLLHMVGK